MSETRGQRGRAARLMSPAALIADAAATVRSAIGNLKPRVGIVLGSGLGKVTERITRPVRIAAADIPGMPLPSVEGHRGEYVAGKLGGTDVLVQSGRLHLYEGHSAAEVVFPVRMMAALGIDMLIVTNAAGGIRSTLRSGDLMLIADHINLTGANPLAGPVMPGEERFPDMSAAYDAALRDRFRRAAVETGIPLAEGVFVGVHGPSYETPAEIAMMQRIGGDAVAMSTVVEVIAARACGIKCAGVSLISNAASGVGGEITDHDSVLEVAANGAKRLGELLERTLGRERRTANG